MDNAPAGQPKMTPAEAAPAVNPAEIKTLLNLPDTASDLDIIQTMAAMIANLQERYDALQSDYTAIRGQDVQNRMEQFADVITPATEDYWREQLIANRDDATAALADLQAVMKNRAPEAAPVANAICEKCEKCGEPMDPASPEVCNKCGTKKGAMKNEAPAPAAPAPAPAAQPAEPLRNRIEGDGVPARSLASLAETPAADAAEAAAISNRAREIQKAKPGTSWVDAFATAEKEYMK